MPQPQTLDIHLEVDPIALAKERDPTRWIAGQSHHTAREAAQARGGKLRHADPIDVHISTAIDLAGQNVLLVATRWIVDGLKEQPT